MISQIPTYVWQMTASAVEATAAWMSVMVQWRMMPYLIENAASRRVTDRLNWLAFAVQRLRETHSGWTGWQHAGSFPTDRVMGILLAKIN